MGVRRDLGMFSPEPSSADDGQTGASQNLRDKRKEPKWFVLDTGTKSQAGSERRDVRVRRDLGMFSRTEGPEPSSANDGLNSWLFSRKEGVKPSYDDMGCLDNV